MTTMPPRHEVAPALQVMMLDWMDRTADWDRSDEVARPRVLFVYTDEIRELPLPPMAYDDHPRVMMKRLADVMVDARRSGELPAKPADLKGVGVLMEFYSVAFKNAEERAYWRTRSFAKHPRAIDTRLMMVHQPGYPPAVAVHERDRRGTGQKLRYPIPMMSSEPVLPGSGGRTGPLLYHLERLAGAVLAPPATFLAGR